MYPSFCESTPGLNRTLKRKERGATVKKLLVVILLSAASLWASGCDKDRDGFHHSPTEPTPPACTYAVQQTPQNFSYQGGNGGFSVSTQGGCSWTAVSNNPWIAVTSGSSGTGNGSVTYIVAGNGGPARTGTISVGGKTVTITQGSP